MESYVIFTVFNFLPHTIFFLIVAAAVAVFFLKVQKSSVVRVSIKNKPLYLNNKKEEYIIEELENQKINYNAQDQMLDQTFESDQINLLKDEQEFNESNLIDNIQNYNDISDLILQQDQFNRKLDKKLMENIILTFSYTKYLNQDLDDEKLSEKLLSQSDEIDLLYYTPNKLKENNSNQEYQEQVSDLSQKYNHDNELLSSQDDYGQDNPSYDIENKENDYEDYFDNLIIRSKIYEDEIVDDESFSDDLSLYSNNIYNQDLDYYDYEIDYIRSKERASDTIQNDKGIKQDEDNYKFSFNDYDNPSLSLIDSDDFDDVYDQLQDAYWDESDRKEMIDTVHRRLHKIPFYNKNLLLGAAKTFQDVTFNDKYSQQGTITTIDKKQLRELLQSQSSVNADNINLFSRIIKNNRTLRKVIKYLYDISYKDSLRLKAMKIRIQELELENKKLKRLLKK